MAEVLRRADLENFRLYPEEKALYTASKRPVICWWWSQTSLTSERALSRDLPWIRCTIGFFGTLPIDRIKVCSHTQADECSCRKPKPGMLLNAARECQIDLTKSFMVGDRASDVAAGIAAGCRRFSSISTTQ